jgi:acetyl esterase/lipase
VRRRVRETALRPEPFAPPRALLRRLSVSVERPVGWPVYELAPRGERPRRRLVHLHGGAYTGEIMGLHWTVLARLTTAVPARVTVPIYPLAPHATADRTVPEVADVVAAAIADAGATDVVLSGDSAGGGLALAVAQHLRDTGRPQPARLVLVAPWLDVTMTHPRQAELERLDRMLARPGLAEAGRLYAGDLDVRDPRVSPLFGDLAGLAPATVVVGTHDLLHPDALAFAERARAAGVEVDLVEGVGQQHVYPFIPLVPEGRAALDAIAALVRP